MEQPVRTKKRRYLLPDEGKKKSINMNLPVYKEILHIVWKYKFCTIDHIATFLASNSDKKLVSPSYQSIQHTISALWHNGYIVKRPVFSRSILRQGTEKDVWCLTSQGASFLAEQEGLFIDDIKYPSLPNKSKPHGGVPENEYQNLKHNLLITDTLASFHVSAKFSQKFKIIYAEHDIQRKFTYSYMTEEGEKKGFIRPDGLLIIESLVPDNEGVFKRANFFLEIDRGTETLGDFQTKLKGYFFMKNKEKENPTTQFMKELYESIDERTSYKELPEQWLQHSRVLTITSTQKRVENLVKATYNTFNNGDGSPKFIFTSKDKFTPLAKIDYVKSKTSDTSYKKYILDFDTMNMITGTIWKSGRKKDVELTKLF